MRRVLFALSTALLLLDASLAGAEGCGSGAVGPESPPGSHGALVAERIGEARFAERTLGGPDAIGGVGDWYLANDIVEIVVDDPARRHAKLNHGGTIVDAGRLDRDAEDQFARLIPIANFSQRVFLDYDTIRAEVDAPRGRARLVVRSDGMSVLPRGGALSRWLDPTVPEEGALAGVTVETVYEVRVGEPFVRIRTCFENTGSDAAPLFSFGEFWMRGLRGSRVFTGLVPGVSKGFVHRTFDHGDMSSARHALAPVSYVVAPGVTDFPPISYGLVAPERMQRGQPLLGLTGGHINVLLGLVGDAAIRGAGLLDLAIGVLTGELEAGEVWRYERRLVVAPRADVASVTDLVWPMLGAGEGLGTVEGRVTPAGVPAAVSLERADGSPVTWARVGADGRFHARVPPGDYVAELRAPQRAPRRLRVQVPAGGVGRIPVQHLAAPPVLVLDPAFADGGPGRVVVKGRNGTPDPVFHDDLTGYRLDGGRVGSGRETGSLYFTGDDGPRRVEVAPGAYRLVAVRGLEFHAQVLDIEVPAEPGAVVPVAPFDLERAVSLPGVVRADFHVHAQASDDTSTPNADRLRQFVAEGIDVIVASDHDHVPDYGPALEATGLEDRLRVITGVEITSSAPSPAAPWSIGHHNAWPIDRLAKVHRRGAPPSQDLGVAALYSALRRDYGVGVIQLNHARERAGGGAGAFLMHLGTEGVPFDPERPLDAGSNAALLVEAPDGTRALGFDAIELLNGAQWGPWLDLRRDWYALLRQGYRRTGTANSDSHGPDQVAGYPRNYVWTGDDQDFSALVRRGRLFGTNGPLVARFTANGGMPGDTVAAPDGVVTVDYGVVAADWVPLEEVRLVVDGRVARRLEALSGRVEVALERDGFVTLEAGAPLDVEAEAWIAAHPGLYTGAIAPGQVPLAFTNPVLVDVDGNGRYDPDGVFIPD